MAIYFSANKVTRTVTIHKSGCNMIPGNLSSCGCGSTGSQGNQQWWCDQHVSIKAIDQFMGNRFWALLVCDKCF